MPTPLQPSCFSRRTPRRRRAFTLIELLTVIAIIGILAAIILPITARVRQSARTAQCQSNMRQIALAVILYANEHRQNHLPGDDPDPNRSGLYGKVYPAHKKGNDKGRLTRYIVSQFQTTLINNEVVMIPVMVCPGFAIARPDLLAKDQVEEHALVYGINTSDSIITGYTGTVWGKIGAGSPQNTPVSLYSIPTPSRTWMLTDWDAETAPYFGWPKTDMAPNPVHGSKRNRVFFDGHVTAVGLKEPL